MAGAACSSSHLQSVNVSSSHSTTRLVRDIRIPYCVGLGTFFGAAVLAAVVVLLAAGLAFFAAAKIGKRAVAAARFSFLSPPAPVTTVAGGALVGVASRGAVAMDATSLLAFSQLLSSASTNVASTSGVNLEKIICKSWESSEPSLRTNIEGKQGQGDGGRRRRAEGLIALGLIAWTSNRTPGNKVWPHCSGWKS